MLEGMKKRELVALVKKHNLHNAIKGYSRMRKAQLVAALKRHMPKQKRNAKKPKRLIEEY
jgi:AAA+ superfamily predicted ATPase